MFFSLCTSNPGIACELVGDISFEANTWDFFSNSVDEYSYYCKKVDRGIKFRFCGSNLHCLHVIFYTSFGSQFYQSFTAKFLGILNFVVFRPSFIILIACVTNSLVSCLVSVDNLEKL